MSQRTHKIRTYQFNFSNSQNLPDEVRFCAFDKDEAFRLFHDWLEEQGTTLGQIRVTSFEQVYDRSDAEFYGDAYEVPESRREI